MKDKIFRCCLIVLSLLVLGSFLAASPAQAGEGGGRCLPLQKDLTNPSIAGFLDQQMLVPGGPQRSILLSSGQKVSTQTFLTGGMAKQAQVTITCKSTCTGNGCSINGCDASSFGCSSCSCFGFDCSACTCTKTSTYTEAPAEPTEPTQR